MPPADPSAEPSPGTSAATGRDRWVDQVLGRLDLELQIGQLMTQVVYGADATTPDDRNLARYGVATPAEVVARYALGGVIYFAWSDNCGDPTQVSALSAGLQEAAAAAPSRLPLDLSIDQETGRVTRIGAPATVFPGAMALGAAGSPELTARTYTAVGRELAAMGITTDDAPVADVNVDPGNPVIGTRSFGADPARVAEHVRAAIEGLHAGGVGAAAKHFPGHGDTDTDSHTALPVVTHRLEEWRRIDAPPFAAAVAAGVDVVMTAHLAFPALDPSGDPATLSRPILTGLLRDELGFDGVVSTDSLGMAGVRTRYPDGEIAVRALEAGVDQLLMSADQAAASAAVLEAVRTGRLTEDRIAASVRRLLAMKYDRGLAGARRLPHPAVIGAADHRALADEVADAAVTVLHGDPVLPTTGTAWVLGPDAGALAALLREAGRPARAAEPGGTGPATGDAVVLVAGSDPVDPVLLDRVLDPARRTPVVAVVTGNPQQAVRLADADAVLLGYSATDVALAALVRVLTGVRTPTGRVPLRLDLATGRKPGADDPDRTDDAGGQSERMNAAPED